MYVLCVIAQSGEISSQLRDALKADGLGLFLVHNVEDLSQETLARNPEAVLQEADFSETEKVVATADMCAQLGLPFILVVPPQLIENYSFPTGVTDFVVPPLATGELKSRVRQILNRRGPSVYRGIIKVGDLTINSQRYEVFVGDRKVILTFKEYQLLKLFASNPGRVYTRQAILSTVWEYEYFEGTRTVDVHVRRLRGKLDDVHHSFIETVRNVGYRFRG